MRNPLRRRWVLVVVNLDTGNEVPLSFMKYWWRKGAEMGCQRIARNPLSGYTDRTLQVRHVDEVRR